MPTRHLIAKPTRFHELWRGGYPSRNPFPRRKPGGFCVKTRYLNTGRGFMHPGGNHVHLIGLPDQGRLFDAFGAQAW